MKKTKNVLNLLAVAFCLLPTTANAQIIPDGTLPNNTIVAPNGETINIEGGTRAGGNLFHSFQEFNLGTGGTAFFNNAADIQSILSRVTGGNISNIDGLIRANGAASLFLVNPAGIVFGPNARLDIGGSFLASSADSVIFNDGSFFSATEPNAPPLLTVNVPIGLQMGANPGDIQVRGPGHQITRETDLVPHNRLGIPDLPSTAPTNLPPGLPPSAALVPLFSQIPPRGLQVQPGNTIAIVGGDVILEGGVLTAYEGRIELGSVKGGNVSINPAPIGGWNLSYEGASQFGDILMEERSLVDASSLLGGGGSIQVQGQNLEMRDASRIFIQNLGLQPSGNVNINIVESVKASGVDSNAIVRSAIGIETIGSGDGGSVNLSASNLLLEDGAAIANTTYGQEIDSAGASGDIDINVTNTVEVLGVASVNPDLFTVILTGTFGAGNAGKLTISTGQLRVTDGASVSGSTLGSGRGGEVNAIASEFVEVSGVEPSNFLPGNLSVFGFREGDSSNLSVNTPRLIVSDGGRVSASTVGSGLAGNVTINAAESVTVRGTVPGSINPSIIDSSATILDESLQQLFSIQPIPTGDTGELTINTSRLTVADGAEIGVQHQGTGNAGALRINASELLVEGGASITAASTSGLGGNLSLDVVDSVLLRDGGRITAEAGGIGDGGNLTINAGTIALLRNSSIDANAFEGSGGNIRVVTEGLFPSADSAITASSQLGVDGTVEVEGLDNEAKGLARLSNNLPDLTALIASGCEEYAGSEYLITGRGGLPPTPSEAIALSSVWQDWRGEGEGKRQEAIGKRQEAIGNREEVLVEATGWVRRDDGTIELVANMGDARSFWHRFPKCPSSL